MSGSRNLPRLHGVTRWQVYSWRKLLKTGALALPFAESAPPAFAQVVVEEAQEASVPLPAIVEIAIGDAVVRVPRDADEAHVALALRAARGAVS